MWHPDTDVRGARTVRLVYKALYCTRRSDVRTGGENLAIKYYFAFSSRSFWLMLKKPTRLAIIIAPPISESDTSLLFAAVSH